MGRWRYDLESQGGRLSPCRARGQVSHSRRGRHNHGEASPALLCVGRCAVSKEAQR